MLLDITLNGKKSVDQLVKASELSVANASQHLQRLKRAGLVVTRRKGKHIYYMASSGPVHSIVGSLRSDLTFIHAELPRYATTSDTDANNVDSISREELLDRLLSGDGVLLDVRATEEYDQVHLLQAKGIPVEILEQRLSELPKDKDIVAYCRGPTCILPKNACKILQSNGFTMKRLLAGYPDWKAAGLSVSETA